METYGIWNRSDSTSRHNGQDTIHCNSELRPIHGVQLNLSNIFFIFENIPCENSLVCNNTRNSHHGRLLSFAVRGGGGQVALRSREEVK